MVLATHLVIGGVLGRVFGVPPLAFLAGFLSHFLLDVLPHWDYSLASRRDDDADPLASEIIIGRLFVFDLAKIGADFLIGAAVLFLAVETFNWSSGAAIIWGAAGGVLPDLLQFAHFKLRWPPLRSLQRFHTWMHTSRRLRGRISGPLWQVFLALVVLFLAAWRSRL